MVSLSSGVASSVQRIELRVSDIRDLSFNISALLAIDGEFLGSLPLGNVFQYIPGCFLNAIENASISTSAMCSARR